MSYYDEFVADYLSEDASTKLQAIGVHSFSSASGKAYGELLAALGNQQDTNALWEQVQRDSPASKGPPKLVPIGNDDFMKPEDAVKLQQASQQFAAENPEIVAQAVLEAEHRSMGTMPTPEAVISQLSRLEEMGRILLTKLDALEKRVQAVEARHQAQHDSQPRPDNDVGEVWEQGSARACAPIGHE